MAHRDLYNAAYPATGQQVSHRPTASNITFADATCASERARFAHINGIYLIVFPV